MLNRYRTRSAAILPAEVAVVRKEHYDKRMTAAIHVGTSGYSFKDWLGTVYPAGTKAGDFLSHYAKMFDTVEINSTYYHVPPPSMFANMLKKVPSDFTFVVKVPKEMTHDREKLASVVSPFIDGIAPLMEAGQLGGLLAQFPYSFKSTSEGIDHLKRLADAFAECETPMNIEFRHTRWYNDETYAVLEKLGLGFVNVDLPPLPGLPGASNIVTSDVAYYRLHGRNAKMWWHHPTPSHRYDYLYNDNQLEEWAQRIEHAATKAKASYIFNNNCHLGQSVVNALHLHQRFGLPRPTLPPGLAPEMFEPSTEELISRIKERIAQKQAEESKP